MNDISFDKTPNAGADAAANPVIDTTTKRFVADVIEESKHRPVLVDFWAPWCGPCRTLSPIIERAVHASKGAVRLVKMNIDDHPAIPGQLGIQSIPAVIAFVDGRPVDGFVGALPEGQVKAFIDKVSGSNGANSRINDVLAQADETLAAGAADRAGELFAAVHQSERENVRAIAGLARSALASGDIERARQMLALAPPAKAKDPVLVAASAEIDLAEQAETIGDADDLMARLKANPKDLQAHFDLAVLSNARGDRAGAADHLLSIISADREWNDQQARKQLLQFFDLWGAKDEATISGRRRLSSLLFS
jgi:putative thioredoxin